MNSIFRKVYQHPFLTEEDLKNIANAHIQEEISKGDFLLQEGKIANDYYLLETGVARGFVHDYDGNEITTEFFAEGDIIIVPSSLFQRISSKENLQAVTDCTVWRIDFEGFQKLFHAIEGFREWGRLWFTFQLFTNKQRYLDMITETAGNRYLKLVKDKPQIVKFAPLKQIASYLGITDSSLSRIRREILYRR